MKKLAIVGSGVSGMSTAYYLRNEFDITVFEKDDYIGGHTRTIDVNEGDKTQHIDMAFMVFHKGMYRNLHALLEELGVPHQDHRGGFNFFDLETGNQYGTQEFELEEHQLVGHYPDSFVSLWRETQRFLKEGPEDFRNKKAFVSLREYLDVRGYSEDFKYGFAVMLGAAVWSVSAEGMLDFPASTLIGFFIGHDAAGLGGRSVNWRTVSKGSHSYMKKIIAALPKPVRNNCAVEQVRVNDEGKIVVTSQQGEEVFDYVVLAGHADQNLRMLADPTEQQTRLLSTVKYHPTRVTLHTDTSVLPQARDRWQSWNYGRLRKDYKLSPYIVYYMNKVQSLDTTNDYFVSLDSPVPIAEDKIITDLTLSHPLFNVEVHQAQKEFQKMNTSEGPIFFAGTYFSSKFLGPDAFGFHDSGLASGLECIKRLRKLNEA